jgi:hypothetical protein
MFADHGPDQPTGHRSSAYCPTLGVLRRGSHL